jgi:hypothetical protein
MPTHITVNGLGLTYKSTIGISTATIPDVCKTPTPGGPVPIPYPNFANQGSLDKGTKTVFAKGGKMIAIKGSEYSMSFGDEPGTIGGVTSNTFKKETAWITYSFDVKMDGQNTCRHTDKKFHNHKNTVDLAGNIDPQTGLPFKLKCGESGSYSKLQEKRAKKTGNEKQSFERDHIPSKAALFKAAKKMFPGLSASEFSCVKGKLEARGFSIAIPKGVHRGFSRTCGSRNTSSQINSDAQDIKNGDQSKVITKDANAVRKGLSPACRQAYDNAVKEARKVDIKEMIKKAKKECAG